MTSPRTALLAMLAGASACAGREEPATRPVAVVAAPADPAAGAAPARATLGDLGALVGGVQVDDEVRLHCLRAEIGPWPAGEAAWDVRQVGPDGAFRWRGPAPAQVGVRLFVAGVHEPLFELGGLAIEPGAVLEDPRLAVVDLRGKVAIATARIVDESGAAVPHVGARPVTRRARASADCRFFAERGELAFYAGAGGAELELDAPGFRTRVAQVRSGDEVALRPGWRVVLRLPDEVPIPDLPFNLYASFAETGNRRLLAVDARGPVEDVRFQFGGERRIEVVVPRTGELTLQWGVGKDTPTVVDYRAVPVEDGKVRVEDVEGLQELRPGVPVEALAKALEKLGG